MKKFSTDIFFYIFILILIFNYTSIIPKNVRYFGFAGMLAIFSFVVLSVSRSLGNNIRNCFFAYSYPYIFAIIYSYVLVIFDFSTTSYLLRGLSGCLYLIIIFLAGYSLFLRYKEKTVDFLFYSFSIAYFSLTAYGIAHYGIGYVLSIALNLSEDRFVWTQEGSEFDKLFEIHEFGLAMPLIALYYLMIHKKKWKSIIIPLIVSLLISLMCAKRIAIAAMLFAFALYVISSIHKFKKIITKVGGYTFLIVSYIYLYFIYSKIYDFLAYKFDIDLRGRDLFYDYFISKSDFSLSYIGHGFGYVTRFLEIYNPLGGIMGVHNDILRMYLELGAIGSIVFFYMMFEYNRIVHRKLGVDITFYFILCTLYCLVTYFSDNTIAYGLIQMVNAVIPINMYFNCKKKHFYKLT